MKRCIQVFVASSCVLFLSGCGDRTTPPATPTAPSPPVAPTPTPPAAPTFRALTVTCAAATLTFPGEQTQCSATVTYTDGTTQDQTNIAAWRSGDSTIATVSSTGLVTAVKAGAAYIWAELLVVRPRNDVFEIEVALPPVARLRGPSVWQQDGDDASFDASESSFGIDQTYRFDFGDGPVTTEPYIPIGTSRRLFEHAYRRRGTFVATLTLVDRQGRRATASTTIKIESLTGTWVNVLPNAAAGRTETRSLQLVQSAGGGITGNYVHPEGNREPLTGTVDQYGGIRMALVSNTIKFGSAGLNGGRFSSADLSSFIIDVTGGSADGQRLMFKRQ